MHEFCSSWGATRRSECLFSTHLHVPVSSFELITYPLTITVFNMCLMCSARESLLKLRNNSNKELNRTREESVWDFTWIERKYWWKHKNIGSEVSKRAADFLSNFNFETRHGEEIMPNVFWVEPSECQKRLKQFIFCRTAFNSNFYLNLTISWWICDFFHTISSKFH